MFEREYRELSWVPRWTIIRRIREQSVAEHSYYVALYAGQVADLVKWKGDRGTLLKWALLHDLAEVFTSDIPGPTKRAMIDKGKGAAFVANELNRRFPDLAVPDGVTHGAFAEIEAIVKVADLIDENCYLASERQLGNGTLDVVRANSLIRLHTAIDNLPVGADIERGYVFGTIVRAVNLNGTSSDSKIVTG